ncbi:MAG: isoprenyl transferase [candidate division WOR-3 bacterium]|nr:isoprenyl transferase [candidate division WOR-3 bacterium]
MARTKDINDALPKNIPQHIAIIMDGNGRWAKKRGLPRFYGHKKGVDAVRKIVRACGEIGVKYLTLYVFSTENWQRPKDEINQLMGLLERLLIKEEKELNKNNVKVKAIGQLDRLPIRVQENLNYLINKTKDNTGLNLILAISYGGPSEIIDAIKKLFKEKQNALELSVESFRQYLYAPEVPDPDLLIRTAGEKRISNYLLWQSAYTELYFTEVLWPDFNKKELIKAIQDYAQRKRRFGRVDIDSEDIG